MSTPVERLNKVAQLLDELSEELPELADLSEELGKIADQWPAPQPREVGEVPEYIREIQHIVERRAEEIMFQRYGGRASDPPYMTINLPNRAYYDELAFKQFDTKNPFTAINSI